jgi:transcription-repair coupling factor (superfamily II helicase)
LLGGDAGKRVQAIRQYTSLGSGYKIAMRDLEIRGAGNLLGTAQSGHISIIGFDLYCRLLRKAVAVLKGESKASLQELTMHLDFITFQPQGALSHQTEARIPDHYMADTNLRITAYRDLTELETLEQWENLRHQWKDRLGRWPESVEILLWVHRIKILAREATFSSLETKEDKLICKRGENYIMIGNKFPRLTASNPKTKLSQIEKWVRTLGKLSSS